MKSHEIQSALWRTPARFICVPAGRRSGKTEIAKRRLVRYLKVDRGHGLTHLYAYLAPTRQQAKDIAWDHLKALVPYEWRERADSESELCIRCAFSTHRAELWVIGMDKPQRFEGRGWDGVVEDEASDQKPNIETSIRPALADRQGWWMKIGVPKRFGTGARRYREMCELGFSGENPEYATFTWPSSTVLPQSEIDEMRASLDEKDFREQIEGAWQTAGGAAFHAFDEIIHVRQCVYRPDRPLLIGSDFNVNPMAWAICQKTKDGLGLEVIDEIWVRNTNTQATLNLLWDRYSSHEGGFMFYGDASGRSRKTSANMSDYAQIANDKRFKATRQGAPRVYYPKSNPAIKDRLSACNALLRNAKGEVRCWIDPRCQHLIADMKHRGLDDVGNPEEASPDGGHISDGWGYLVHALWPSTKLAQITKPVIGIYNAV